MYRLQSLPQIYYSPRSVFSHVSVKLLQIWQESRFGGCFSSSVIELVSHEVGDILTNTNSHNYVK